MGGDATISGTNYQASVIAYAFVHLLTDTKLRWLPITDDTPSAVAGEVKGPGDDARIEFRAGAAPVEIQVKHGLKPQKCIETFQAIRDRSSADASTAVILVVDSTSSPAVRNDLVRDLERVNSGRTDGLKEITRNVIAALGDDWQAVMPRVRIVTLDLAKPADAGATRALELLSENLEDPSRAASAWAVLEREAALIGAEKSRRTRKALLDVLTAAGIALRPPKLTRKWHDELRYTRKLLNDDEPAFVLSLVKEIETDLRKSGLRDNEVLYRLNQHRASALLRLGKHKEGAEAAERALDHDPEGLHALVTLANAKALLGEVDEARVLAEKATTLHPQAPMAWLMRFQISLEPGQEPVATPPDVAAVPEYETELIRVYLFHGDAEKARETAASRIRSGDRTPRVLLLRVEALLTDIDSAPDVRMARAGEIERLCTEVLDDTGELSDRLRQQALAARSAARRILGNTAGAEEDSERAHAIRRDDARVLGEAAQAKLQAGNELAALELLENPIVDEQPFLVAMRASLLANHGQRERARKALDTVLQAIPSFPQPDSLRSAAAELALHLDEVELAKKLVGEMSSGETVVHRLITTARIAVRENDFATAERHYRSAFAIDPAHRDDLLLELASRLLGSKRPSDAVSVIREMRSLPPAAERLFVRALVEAEDLAGAHVVLQRLAVAGSMPDWAVGYAAEIALRRNDPESAARHLEDLLTRGQAPAEWRLILAETLIELEQHQRACMHVDALAADTELSARERMMVAQLLMRLGDGARAITVALEAYREDPQDADINRAFSSLVFLSKSPPIEVDRIGPDTHALLRTADGATLEYLVFAHSKPQKLPQEIDLQDATEAGLLGLRIGDEYVQNPGAWFSKHWRVEQVQTAVRYLVNDIVANYSTRFPNAPFFATGFQFNSESPTVRDFQPMISSAHERRQHLERILTVYREQCLPLAFVADLCGASVPALMEELSRPDGDKPLYVEWADDERRRASRDAARARGATVLTRSALATAQAFDFLPLLARDRQCIAPRSLRDELRGELTEAEEHVRDGWKVLAASDQGFAIHEREPGHPDLVRRRDSVRALLEWADANVAFVPRPLEAFGDSRLNGRDMRKRLGESSHDALELALYYPAVLYSDDLGLRRLADGLNAKSFATPAFVQVAAEHGWMSGQALDRLLVTLAERHFNSLEASPEMLLEALSPGRSMRARDETFALLAGPSMDVLSAARTVVRAVKAGALRTLKITTTEQLVTHGLVAMALKFPLPSILRAMITVADAELALLQNDLRAVKGACAAFKKSRTGSLPRL